MKTVFNRYLSFWCASDLKRRTWCRDVMVIISAQLHSTKLEPRFCEGANIVCGVLEIYNAENL